MADVERSLARDRSSLWTGRCTRRLPEKCMDLDMLVMICEETNNKVKLDQYMNQYSDTSFSSHVVAAQVIDKEEPAISFHWPTGTPHYTDAFLQMHMCRKLFGNAWWNIVKDPATKMGLGKILQSLL